MTFPKYPEYKNSGVEWLGEVPAHWDVRRLKFVLSQITDRATERVNPVALENIEGWSGRYVEGESDYSGEGVAFRKGDLLFGKLRPYLAKVYLPSRRGEAVGDFHVMRPCPNLSERYAFHQLLQPQFISVVDGATHGAKMPRVGWEVMGNMPFVTPPHYEQAHIATFLDHETARIDALVEEQQRLIELLKEKRQAVISHAVTKGLDPDVPMKDSGVEWLGEVPAHWEALPLKYLVREPLKYGANEAASDNNSDHPRFVRITDVSADGTLRDETFRSLPPDVAKQYLLEEGDILFARSGATVGKSFLYKRSWGECCFAGYLIRARIDFRMALPEFVYFSFQSHGYWQYIGQQQIQATIQNVSAERYDSYVLPTPPVDEQARIVEHLNQHLGGYSELLETAEQSVSLLQERRSALISAAVTGKIDVRGWQPPAGSPALFEATQTEAV